ncbi:MAG: Uma2 family endonuclease [Chloroflexia bacterium]
MKPRCRGAASTGPRQSRPHFGDEITPERQATVEEWTYERLLELPEEDYPRRYEIIDGVLHELPTPEDTQARRPIAYTLHVTVRARGGQAFIAPVDVLLSSRARPVQPDVIVLLPEHLDQMRDAFVEGPPDIVVEVLSPNDPKRDRVLKREVYAAGGVPEYWLVSPEAAQSRCWCWTAARTEHTCERAATRRLARPCCPSCRFRHRMSSSSRATCSAGRAER